MENIDFNVNKVFTIITESIEGLKNDDINIIAKVKMGINSYYTSKKIH